MSLNNESFTYFLPLYFGSHKERTLKYAEKALSIVCRDVSNGFDPQHVLDVLPRILVTTVIDIADQNIYFSHNNLKFFIYVLRLLNLFIEQYPDLMEIINDRLAILWRVRRIGTRIPHQTSECF